MTNFETRLKESLSAEDEAFLRNLEEGESLFGQLGSTFSGPASRCMARPSRG